MPNPFSLKSQCFGLNLCALLMLILLVPEILQAQDMAQVKNGVVKITAQVDGKTKVGTGLIVRVDKDAASIVTAAHVVEGDSKPTVTFFSNPQQPLVALIVGIQGGDQNGLAALRVAGPIPDDVVALPLDLTTKVVGGEALTFIGFPRTLPPWTVSTGSLSGMNGPTLAFQALVEEGHSGGPLLLNGQVIGVVSDTRERLGYAVPASIVSVALKGWHIDPRPSDSMVPQEKIGADGVRMILIRSGRFPTKIVSVGGFDVSEIPGPPRFRYVPNDVYVDATLVTNRRIGEFAEATGLASANIVKEALSSVNPDDPFDEISWRNAVNYCQWVHKRLPTEEEWEKAARDTNGRILSDRIGEWTGSLSDSSRPVIRGKPHALGKQVVEGDVDYQVRMFGAQDEAIPLTGFRCAVDIPQRP